ncbi:hypothetical protein BDW69DRAFT_177357 [Aspergillus filifer]
MSIDTTMSSRTIFLVGAPTFSTLQWEESGLLSESVPPFQNSSIHHETPRMLQEDNSIKWRLLPGSIDSETPHSKCSAGIAARAHFLTTHDLATFFGRQEPTRGDTEQSQFYDHSFTVHETSEISAQCALLGGSTLDSNLGTESTGTSFATNEDGEVSIARPHIQGGITDLQDIPNSAYLNSIIPQTMTVNLIATIIAVRPPRRIVTRQWKRELDLVEAVVGDETRTGFGVTFWLPPLDNEPNTRQSGKNAAGDELRRLL